MKLHPTVKELLREIEAHRRVTGMSRTAFSIRITGDGHLVRRMYLGHQPKLQTIDKIRRYLRNGKSV